MFYLFLKTAKSCFFCCFFFILMYGIPYVMYLNIVSKMTHFDVEYSREEMTAILKGQLYSTIKA